MSRPSLRTAINNHCKECVYDPYSRLGNWKQQVYLCTVSKCHLYAVRPTPRTESSILEAERLAEIARTGDYPTNQEENHA